MTTHKWIIVKKKTTTKEDLQTANYEAVTECIEKQWYVDVEVMCNRL